MKGPAAEKETEVPLMVGSPGVWTSGLLLAQPGLAPCSPGSFKCTRGGATAMSFNSTQRFLERYIYNEEEYIQLDSNVGVFKAMTELDQTTAKNWNIQKEFLELRRQAVDVVCKHKDELDKGFTLKSRGSLQHHNLLVCHVTDFYPGSIEIRWFRNGQEETAGIVTADLIRNGDWTFRILVMLEMTPQKGDVYTCHVEHPSLDSPVTVEWDLQIRLQDLRQEPESVAGGSSLTMGLFFPEAQSDSAQSKMLTGVGGFALGLIFLLMSFVGYSLPFCCLTHLLSCNKEAEAEKQNHRAQEATGN
ncbi:HLA class II histocompatibility antigen, DP beta 1 chain-like [Loxodonta africana]|uniref:HLA class II histocompatibility antigen, DP beta 1 chain-like n=1 Tax=Loxodonta africana TaxID=9785 RepID=UPI0030CFD864